MSHRLLHEGTNAPYDELHKQLQEGEVLVATWLRDPAMIPYARPVNGEGDYTAIVGKTTYGYYVELRFFASTTGSEDYHEYNTGPSDLSRLAMHALGASMPSAPPLAYTPPRAEPVTNPNWGETFHRHLTREWQEIVPGLRMKKIYPTTCTFNLLENGEWSHNYGATEANNWWEFTPGLQLRKSPTKPGVTEFRQKKQ